MNTERERGRACERERVERVLSKERRCVRGIVLLLASVFLHVVHIKNNEREREGERERIFYLNCLKFELTVCEKGSLSLLLLLLLVFAANPNFLSFILVCVERRFRYRQ